MQSRSLTVVFKRGISLLTGIWKPVQLGIRNSVVLYRKNVNKKWRLLLLSRIWNHWLHSHGTLGQRVSYSVSWPQMHSKLEWMINKFFFSWETISWNGNICLQTILGEFCCSLCVWYRILEQQKYFWGQNWNYREG